mmetsp:Transcript_129879/g.289799  ORF Transcript_129879/g.289799 Transcript_129879/m.289799 type:complete len:226 (+) Transcript_129879:768-1445(+)
MATEPNMAKPYVTKKMTTHVQKKVVVESPRPRISNHASLKTFRVRTNRASLSTRIDRSTVNTRSPPPSKSAKASSFAMVGSNHVERILIKTSIESKKCQRRSPVSGQKLRRPRAATFASNSTVKQAVKTLSATQVQCSKRAPPQPSSQIACASSPMARQFITIIVLTIIWKVYECTTLYIRLRRSFIALDDASRTTSSGCSSSATSSRMSVSSTTLTVGSGVMES